MIDRPIQILNRLKLIRMELEETTLIAVTKYSPMEDLVFAYNGEQYDFGENKVQDLKEKAQYFLEHQYNHVRWHFIGHLQSNKVKDLLKIPNLVAIHSVDSLKLLEEIIKRMNIFEGERLNLFLQVNTSKEEEKSGFESIDELKEAISLLINTKGPLRFYGLMTLGTIRTEHLEEEAHRCFKHLSEIKKEMEDFFKIHNLKLSMGMSGDFKVAIEHGSNFVRIGTSIFK